MTDILQEADGKDELFPEYRFKQRPSRISNIQLMARVDYHTIHQCIGVMDG
jgi:hypothetical protein